MFSFSHLAQSKNIKMIVIMTFFTISIVAYFGMRIYHHYYLSTDNAYVNAYTVQMAPLLTGKVVHVNVVNNQYVKKGDLLFSIDPMPLQLAVNSAKAELALRLAELENAKITQQRVSSLVEKKYLSSQEGDNAIANFKMASAKVEEAKAQLAEAMLNLSYANVSAPVSGWISNISLRVGDIVSENQPLFVLISDEEFWVDANFKETEMQAIQPNQTASIISDMYPDHPFKGKVESISGGAGTVFSLLPPQNATGNWVKVTQRVPVRIKVLNPNPNFPLRIGTSAAVTIHLHSVKGHA